MIDPEREYCSCGYSFIPSTFLKIRLLIQGDVVMRCPRCQSEMKLHMTHFVYVIERKQNRNKEIWRNG